MQNAKFCCKGFHASSLRGKRHKKRHKMRLEKCVESFSSASNTMQAGNPLLFTSSSSDPDNDALTQSWDFGDDTRGGGSSIAHVFPSAGTFTVKLLVADGKGGSSSTTQSITVTAGTPAGPALNVEVWNRIRDNAVFFGNAPYMRRQIRAFAAVSAALGNTPPGILISSVSPASGQVANTTNSTTFTATVSDLEDSNCCTVTWSSDLDGNMGTGNPFTFKFEGKQGKRTITATVKDSAGRTSSATTTYSIYNNSTTTTVFDVATFLKLRQFMPELQRKLNSRCGYAKRHQETFRATTQP